jgi:hypothetical protein
MILADPRSNAASHHLPQNSGDVIRLSACYDDVGTGLFERMCKMKPRVLCVLAFCLPALLLLTGCLSKDQPSIPDSNTEGAHIPAQVRLARDQVIEYVNDSACLTDVPPVAEWQAEEGMSPRVQYHLRSGDWRMVVWPADSHQGNQRVVLFNPTTDAFWCGYVDPGGQVVNTALVR